jgi:hypothetical protein
MPRLARSLILLLLPIALSFPARAGDSVDHRVDESKNAGGPHRCTQNKDCDGKRTCSAFGWCQGNARPKADLTVPKPPVQSPSQAPAPAATLASIDGSWVGMYERRNPKGRGIDLRLALSQDGRTLSGGGDAITRALQVGEATTTESGVIEGQIDAAREVRFRLVLRSGPVRDFKGTLAPDGRSIGGTWSEGGATGVFLIQRAPGVPLCGPAA